MDLMLSGLAAYHDVTHQRQSVIAEVHVIAADEGRRRAQGAARGGHLVSVRAQPVLHVGPRNAVEEALRVDPEPLAGALVHGIPGDVDEVDSDDARTLRRGAGVCVDGEGVLRAADRRPGRGDRGGLH